MPFAWGREHVAREADMWVARLHGPDADRHFADAQQWRAADPRHEAAFQRSQALWSATGSATRTPNLSRMRPSPPVVARVGAGRRLAFASFIALIATGGGAILLERAQHPTVREDAPIASYEQPRAVRLIDGSIVRLAANSVVAPHFNGEIRAITLLEGSARFSVAHDVAHPFVVTAGDRTVTARGTIFDVALLPSGLSVTMIEGIVEVARPPHSGAVQATVRLKRGERLIVTHAAETVTPVPAGISNMAATDYPPTPLSRVIEDANRMGHKPIRLGDAGLGAALVQGRFDLTNTGGLAQQLAAALDLALRDDGGAFTLVRSPIGK